MTRAAFPPSPSSPRRGARRHHSLRGGQNRGSTPRHGHVANPRSKRILVVRRDGVAQRYRVSAKRLGDYDLFPYYPEGEPGRVSRKRTRKGGGSGRMPVRAYVFNPKRPDVLAEVAAALLPPEPRRKWVEVRFVVAGDYRSEKPGHSWHQEREFVAVLREADIPRFTREVADYMRGTGFPLDVSLDRDPMDAADTRDYLVIGEVGPRKPTNREPGIYDMRVRMKGKEQPTAEHTMESVLAASDVFSEGSKKVKQ